MNTYGFPASPFAPVRLQPAAGYVCHETYACMPSRPSSCPARIPSAPVRSSGNPTGGRRKQRPARKNRTYVRTYAFCFPPPFCSPPGCDRRRSTRRATRPVADASTRVHARACTYTRTHAQARTHASTHAHTPAQTLDSTMLGFFLNHAWARTRPNHVSLYSLRTCELHRA